MLASIVKIIENSYFQTWDVVEHKMPAASLFSRKQRSGLPIHQNVLFIKKYELSFPIAITNIIHF